MFWFLWLFRFILWKNQNKIAKELHNELTVLWLKTYSKIFFRSVHIPRKRPNCSTSLLWFSELSFDVSIAVSSWPNTTLEIIKTRAVRHNIRIEKFILSRCLCFSCVMSRCWNVNKSSLWYANIMWEMVIFVLSRLYDWSVTTCYHDHVGNNSYNRSWKYFDDNCET